MIKELLDTLARGENPRETLSKLRGLIKEESVLDELKDSVNDGSKIAALLQHEDAKTRKNAALLLGDLQLQNTVGALKEAYEKEQTLFVKSAYLTARHIFY